MPRRLITNGLLSLGLLAFGFALPHTLKADSKVPVRAAVQTTIGPADAPVRNAVLTPADKQRVKVEPVHWGGRAYAGYYGPSYAYYRRPYYAAYPAYPVVPYAAYYAPAPYYSSYYAPGPYYAPAYVYRAPRRVVVPYGGYYW